jgi:hypothetical protein
MSLTAHFGNQSSIRLPNILEHLDAGCFDESETIGRVMVESVGNFQLVNFGGSDGARLWIGAQWALPTFINLHSLVYGNT